MSVPATAAAQHYAPLASTSTTTSHRATPPPTSASRIPIRAGSSGSPNISYSPRTRFLSNSTAGAASPVGSPKTPTPASVSAGTWSPSLNSGSPSVQTRQRRIITSPKIGNAGPSSTFRGDGRGGSQPKRAQLGFIPSAATTSDALRPPPSSTGRSNPSHEVLTFSRSESDKSSINSINLAHALGLDDSGIGTGAGAGAGEREGVEGDDMYTQGERLINDELPPFVVSDDRDSRQTQPQTEEPTRYTQTSLTDQNQNQTQSMFMDGYGKAVAGFPTDSRTSTSVEPQDQRRTAGAAVAPSTRQRKPSGTTKPIQTQSQANTTPRSSSAQELGRFITSSSSSSSPPTKSPAISKTTRGLGLGITSSSSTREFSSYPAEAYLIPQITDYRPPQGSAWDDTVIPTIAKRLRADAGRERGKVGLGFFENEKNEMDREAGTGVGREDDDELVTEWTADGRPVKALKLDHSANPSTKMAEQRVDGQGQERMMMSEFQSVGDGGDTVSTDANTAPVEQVGQVMSDDPTFTKQHVKGDSVLSDILAEYTSDDHDRDHEHDQPQSDHSTRDMPAPRSEKAVGHDVEDEGSRRTAGANIAGVTDGQPGPVLSTYHHDDDVASPHPTTQREMVAGTNMNDQITTEPISDVAVAKEPHEGEKHTATSMPVKQEQQPACVTDNPQPRSEAVLPSPRAGVSNGTTPQEGVELQNLRNERPKMSDAAVKPVPKALQRKSRGKGKTDDTHSGGCRCIIM